MHVFFPAAGSPKDNFPRCGFDLCGLRALSEFPTGGAENCSPDAPSGATATIIRPALDAALQHHF
jgi:hypothetical protein